MTSFQKNFIFVVLFLIGIVLLIAIILGAIWVIQDSNSEEKDGVTLIEDTAQ